jgi:hypothetical protein
MYSNGGGTYVGQFRDNNFDGTGTLINADGTKYIGEFRDGRIDGQGTRIFPNKTKFIGEFRNGSPYGEGTYYGANGATLNKGEWSSPTWAEIIRKAGDEQQSIRMVQSGGVYVVPVRFNDSITLDAVVDSGATDVSIPADVVYTLIRTKTITQEDFLGKQTYVLADGSKVPSQQFRIRSLKVGNKIVENVVASIASANATILLGQSFLKKFKSWSVDNEQHALILR